VLGGVLLTHRHPDHADALGSPLLREALAATGAPVLAADPSLGDPPAPTRSRPRRTRPVRLLPVPGTPTTRWPSCCLAPGRC
jgi:glyoxylase-like metal-dependent hydrolase (beta-lactamase superfamily II)